MPPKNVFTDFC